MPETKTGTCPWCERQNQTLYFTSGFYAEGSRYVYWIEYVCAHCRWAYQRRTEETEPCE